MFYAGSTSLLLRLLGSGGDGHAGGSVRVVVGAVVVVVGVDVDVDDADVAVVDGDDAGGSVRVVGAVVVVVVVDFCLLAFFIMLYMSKISCNSFRHTSKSPRRFNTER